MEDDINSDSSDTATSSSVDLLNFDREELTTELSSRFELESFRARQLVNWLYKRRITDFEQMTDISKIVRDQLAEVYTISRPKPVTIQKSKDGTRKYLFELSDGSRVESVLIAQATRYTLCVSSQVGCAIGCGFCRTAQMGLKRNLKTAEIIGQVLAVLDDLEAERFYNIVFMGMGEPFHNINNVIRTVKILNDPLGLDFSARKITVSTSGLVPAIKKFGDSKAGANLAISLNATTDEVREKIMPINKRWPLEDLLSTLRAYPLKKGRRITIEYVMLKGVNDSDQDLERLPKILRGIPSKINLIPYNDNTGLGYHPPSLERINFWQQSLLGKGMNSTIRWSKGDDISAACGQLATA